MSKSKLDQFRSDAVEKYKQMCFALVENEESVNPDSIAGICFAAGRSAADLERNVQTLKERHYWTVGAPREQSNGRANSHEWSTRVSELEEEIERVTKETERRLIALNKELTIALSRRAGEQGATNGLASARQRIFQEQTPEWTAQADSLAREQASAIEQIRCYAEEIALAEKRGTPVRELRQQLLAGQRRLEKARAAIQKHDEKLRDWRTIDWTPLTPQPEPIPRLV